MTNILKIVISATMKMLIASITGVAYIFIKASYNVWS
jgi:hypothetical protein